MENQKLISKTRINRIRAQGYLTNSDSDISQISFGNRFAYLLCSAILIVAVSTANVPLLYVMLTIAFFGIVLPNHPFDYIYNYVLRQQMGKPKLPPRSKQLKFACTVATLWIAGTIYLFTAGLTTAGYVFGAALITVATLVGTTDICIPSLIWNYVFKVDVKSFCTPNQV